MWEERERRISHGNFNGPGPEVARIPSVHVPFALSSREVEKESLAMCTGRRAYGFGSTHAY